jgi:CheY-like chemotaxis protein
MARILVVEDDEPLRTMVSKLVRSWGHEVMEAANGEEGITAFIRNPAEVIITDIMMPEKDGLNVIVRLRQDYPGTKIIVMSGGLAHGPGAYLELAEQLGADQTLRKPFSKEELRTALAAVISGKQD